MESSCQDISNYTEETSENLKTNAISHILRNRISASGGQISQENVLSSCGWINDIAEHITSSCMRRRFKIVTGKYEGICSLSCFAYVFVNPKLIFKTS